MLRENLKDTGEILQNILRQPLSVEGATPDISLLDAALTYNPSAATSSDLVKVLQMFQQYPQSTEMLLTELTILSSELKRF